MCVSSAELCVSKAACWTLHLCSVTHRGWPGPQSSSEHLDGVSAPSWSPPITLWPAHTPHSHQRENPDGQESQSTSTLHHGFLPLLTESAHSWEKGRRGPTREGRGKDSREKGKQVALLSKSISTHHLSLTEVSDFRAQHIFVRGREAKPRGDCRGSCTDKPRRDPLSAGGAKKPQACPPVGRG